MGKINRSSVGIFVWVVGCFIFLNSCGEPYGGSGNSQVFLTIEGTDIFGITSDVFDPTIPGNVEDDFVEFTITSIPKNSRVIEEPGQPSDVILNQQNVTYIRPDGNPEVPPPFTRFIGNIIVPTGGSTDINILILPATSKLKPPLSDLAFGGGDGEIFLTAVIELFGEDFAGNPISVKGTMSIIAKDVLP